MKESSAMLEIRKIRDENSLRHINMSSEELDNELKKSMDWFLSELGRPVNIISEKKNY